MVTAIAKREGFALTLVERGKDAIEKITHEKFDLVISDLTIVGGTGSEVVCRMRVSEFNAGTAFVLLTSDENSKLIGELFGLDKIDSYVPKPVTFVHMSAHILMMLGVQIIRRNSVREINVNP